MELDKDSFQAYIDAAGDKLVVVDFFTDVSDQNCPHAHTTLPAVRH
jgi:hypothetical protein